MNVLSPPPAPLSKTSGRRLHKDRTNNATIETIVWEQIQMRHVLEEEAKMDIVLICGQDPLLRLR